MERVGVKDLKAHLSGYLDLVAQGEQIVITEHGREAALIMPISTERRAINRLIEVGRAVWHGGKPKGLDKRIRISGQPFSETILEKRQ
ncbi:MAG TPA: type II toxin-antitoxin system prevent-host-death family antitoxin [Dissulfurispiraceae bacterium]|nr:type II toxin-antitoxin system prevent-host-death family antitoxin [Dissulfurispiraceae bacterium]